MVLGSSATSVYVIFLIVNVTDVLALAIAEIFPSLSLKLVKLLFVEIHLLEVLDNELILFLQEVDVLFSRGICVFLEIVGTHL